MPASLSMSLRRRKKPHEMPSVLTIIANLPNQKNRGYLYTMQRDYSTISPSARSLLLMKAMTPIPYMRHAAEIISQIKTLPPDPNNDHILYWIRIMHFEERYTSINQLLEGLEPSNMLELSSGFSFRGLDFTTKRDGIHYIDTDLPGVIETKRHLLEELGEKTNPNSKFELLPLNALNEEELLQTVARFKPGPVTFINEGLLMYLDDSEKLKLCNTIRNILKERGGYWVTADIYVKGEYSKMPELPNDDLAQLVERERIEEKKFDSFEQAEQFFSDAGFIIDKVAVPDYRNLSSAAEVIKRLPPEALQGQQGPPRIHDTWQLKVK